MEIFGQKTKKKFFCWQFFRDKTRKEIFLANFSRVNKTKNFSDQILGEK